MTDKEKFLNHWKDTLGHDEAMLAWEAKQKQQKTYTHMVMSDIGEYKSMIDGSLITSRSKHKTHLKDHGCIELGNDVPKQHVAKPYHDPRLTKRIAELVYAKL